MRRQGKRRKKKWLYYSAEEWREGDKVSVLTGCAVLAITLVATSREFFFHFVVDSIKWVVFIYLVDEYEPCWENLLMMF